MKTNAYVDKHWTKAFVPALPKCDLCPFSGFPPAVAHYDAATKAGPWAFMCEPCYRAWGVGLGMGRGQELVTSMESLTQEARK